MASGGMLLSSPIRTRADTSLVIIPSSPDFPSIAELAAKRVKKPPLRSGSHAAPIPEGAPKSFTSAASLWRSLSDEDDKEDRVIAIDEPIESAIPEAAPQEEVTGPAAKQRLSNPSASAPRPDPPATAADTVPKRQAKPKRKNKAVECDNCDGDTTLPNAKPRKKLKQAKEASESQTTLPKGRVTKPTSRRNANTGGKGKPETVSRHIPKTDPIPVELIEIDDTVEPEPALSRRMDWTPTKDTAPVSAPISSSSPPFISGTPSPLIQDGESGVEAGATTFKDLVETYGCKPAPTDASASITAGDNPTPVDVFGKRKQLDLVTTREAKTPEPPSVKAKAPKKKPRTITELATAAYRANEGCGETNTEQQSQGSSLLDYLDTDHDKLPKKTDSNPTKGKKKAVAKKPAKQPKAPKKTGQGSKKQRLLSPASAMRLVSGQDFVFGTSSQLATEEDAALLRDLQEAIKRSNEGESASSDGDEQPRGRSINRLWGAGNRDIDGDLLCPEVIDLSNSPEIPKIPKDLTNPAVINALADIPRNEASQPPGAMSVPKIVPEIEPPSSPILTGINARVRYDSAQGRTSTTQIQTPPLPDMLEGDDELPASNQELNELTQSARAGSSDDSGKSTPNDPRPKYELFTDAQLAREIRGYGFKPVKKRGTMIALLDQCWSSKNKGPVSRPGSSGLKSRTSTANMSTSTSTQMSATQPAPASSTARPRGRPRKNARSASPPAASETGKKPRAKSGKKSTTATVATSTRTGKPTTSTGPGVPPAAVATAVSQATTKRTTSTKRKITTQQPIVEIADSESEDDVISIPPSPAPSPQPDGLFSSPQSARGMDTSVGEEDTELSLTVSPSSQQADIFGFITKAVTTAPRSTDPTNPSWHEKMLMYDPIVLEDLAAWLNSGQLDRVGYDEEVGAEEVKKWCESKSICCLWKFNLHGAERKRF